MSIAELHDIVSQAQEEINRRKDERYMDLVNDIVSAWNQLYREFPYTELSIETNDGDEIDVFAHFKGRLSADDFCR